MSVGLVKYEAARRALSEAHSVDEVKDIRDKATAMEAYARQAKDTFLQTWAAEIKIRAERRAGEMLVEREKAQGKRTDLVPQGNQVDETPTLSDIGITNKQSSQWQAIASVSEEDFEAEVEAANSGKKELTSAGVLKIAKQKKLKEKAEMRRPENDTCTADDLFTLAQTERKFRAILADPPWSFKVYSGKGKSRSAEQHYDTMTLDDIKALPVAPLAAEDCALFLWAVMPQLPEALEVIKAWGFEYKTCGFTWVKRNAGPAGGFATGMGYWTRSNAELCLLATKGRPERLHKDVQQLLVAPRGQHSAKPQEVHERIERLVSGPYLELFGRRISEGWTVWGNEIERTMFEVNVPEAAA